MFPPSQPPVPTTRAPTLQTQVRTSQRTRPQPNKNRRLWEPGPAKLRIQPRRAREQNGCHPRNPIHTTREGSHADRVARDLARRARHEQRAPGEEERGGAQRCRQSDCLAAVEP